MSTALLIGSMSPALTSLSSIVRSLDCHIFNWHVFDRYVSGTPATGRYAQTVRFDLIVTEFRPQETSTAQFLDLISTFGPLPLVVTGPDLPARQRGQIEAARQGTVYLPINSAPGRKLEAVRALLPEVPRAQLRVGPLQLNTTEGVARYGQHTLPLTSTEFKLLHSLMRRPGQTIDCGTLSQLSQCQDVPTHVGNLRRKFSGCAAGPLLRGNRQVGYAIDARHHQRTARNAGFALRDHLLHLI